MLRSPRRIVHSEIDVKSWTGKLPSCGAPGEAPVMTDVIGRRYACRACDAIIIVVPLGVARGHR